MKFLFSLFVVFTIAIRPVLPLINYAVNYDYIVRNLCEKRDRQEANCKGICFLEKELAKTEKQSNNGQNIKIAAVDLFLSQSVFSFSDVNTARGYLHAPNVEQQKFFPSEYFSKIFHPPVFLG